MHRDTRRLGPTHAYFSFDLCPNLTPGRIWSSVSHRWIRLCLYSHILVY